MVQGTYFDGKVRNDLKRFLCEKTGYCIKSSMILNQAFRRSSFAAENGLNSNEVFEFIGDQVLNMYVVKIMTDRCGSLSIVDDYTFRIRENKFTQIKQSLVNNEALAKIIDEWDIAKYMFLSKSDMQNNVSQETKVKADLFEAIIGAIAVESNWDAEILENVVKKSLNVNAKINEMIKSDYKVKQVNIDNAVTILKELAEQGECTMPKYDFMGHKHLGHYKNGDPKWTCTCTVINEKIGLMKTVYSNSKKAVKKAAAYLILCEQLSMQNQYGPNDWFGRWHYQNGELIPLRTIDIIDQ